MTHSILWTLFRKDIGRKLTALGLAVGVWVWLAHNLAGERAIVLEMRVVETRREAEDAQVGVPAVYVVKPKEFILLEREPVEVTVHVRGLKADLDSLELSAVFDVPPDALGTGDRGAWPLMLDNPAQFRALGGAVDDLELSVSPTVINLELAREDRIVFDLGSDNVQVTGVPKSGHEFDRSRAVVEPSQVELIGPRNLIEEIRSHPSLLKFEALDLEGQSFTVTRYVGLDRDRVDRSVRLARLETVKISVPIYAAEFSRELYSVRVTYENKEDLDRRGLQVVDKDDFLDLLVSGPKDLLDTSRYSDVQLLKKIRLVFDWADAKLLVSNAEVATPNELPDAITIEALDGGPPQIKYELAKKEAAVPPAEAGDSP